MKYIPFFFVLCINLFNPLISMEEITIGDRVLNLGNNINNQKDSILYMPWRANYNPQKNAQYPTIPTTEQKPCIFCKISQENNDKQNYIFYRGNYVYGTIATQPYVNFGMHLLFLPYDHGKELSKLSLQAIEELNNITKKVCAYYSSSCNEIHIGFNIGKYAGASIPDHLHQHIVVDNLRRYNDLLLLEKIIFPTFDPLKTFQEAQQIFLNAKPLLPINTSVTNNQNNCYYCKIFNQKEDKENFIIHRDDTMIILLNHAPQRPGHISIFPQKHKEDIATLSKKKYNHLYNLARKVYPLILEIVDATDVNIGTTSYGQTSELSGKNHLQLDIIPRKDELIGSIDIISHKRAIAVDINKMYEQIVDKCKNIDFKTH